MVDIHIYVIPTDFWRDSLNSVSSDAVIEAISAGFLQVDPETSLSEIRHHIYEQLPTDVIPNEFCFLRIVGRCLARVSDKQEIILRAKSFLPPLTFSPDIYLIDARIAKRNGPRSTGSNNSDIVSFPRLTPNQNNPAQEPDQSANYMPSPVPIKSLQLPRSDFEMEENGPRTSHRQNQITQRIPQEDNTGDNQIVNDHDYKEKQTAETDNNPHIADSELSTSEHVDNANVLAVKVQLAKRERAELEVKRKRTLKKLHELQEMVQHRRKEAYEYWRARFTDEKGRTPYLEEQAASLGKDIDNLHKKLVRQLGNNNSGDGSLLTRQLQVLKLRQTVDLLKLKVEEGQTKLMCQIRLRNQAETELRAMRAELTQKKVLVQLLKSKLPAATEVL